MRTHILFVLLFVPFFSYGQKVAIAGEKKPVANSYETYIVENHAKPNGGNATWTVVGGTFDGINTSQTQSVEKNKVGVRWRDTSSGTLYYSYESYSGQIDVKIQQGSTEEPPPAGGHAIARIRISGSNKTYNNYISFNAEYDKNGMISSGSASYKWTFTNAGTTTTRTGTSARLFFPNVGKTDILLEVTQKTSGGSTSVAKASETITLVDGTSVDPDITGINGATYAAPGVTGHYTAEHDFAYSNVTYRWALECTLLPQNVIVPNSGNAFNYTFQIPGNNYSVSCIATNTKTGRNGRRAFINVWVDGNGPIVRSLAQDNNSYQLVNLNNVLIVSEIEKDNNYVQINNALTGFQLDQGKVIVGSSIDISRLLKGIYVVTLTNGAIKEAHKISVK